MSRLPGRSAPVRNRSLMPKNVAKLAFWGVRGSTPTSDRNSWRYGGNTPCLDLETPEGSRFILDCGTGLRMLGSHWQHRFGKEPIEASVFLTHYHWDHIQGIPFFVPLYAPQNQFRFYSFRSEALGQQSLQQALYAQMVSPFFPVNPEVLVAAREFNEVASGDRWEIDGTRISTAWLNHPQGCLGFRFETSAGTIVYATDNEPGVPELDSNLRRLARDADVLICDAQYTPEQLAGNRKGWGHSSWLEAVKLAEEVGARQLVLFHHDPESVDSFVDGLLQQARQRLARVWAASEGMRMTLGKEEVEVSFDENDPGAHGKASLGATVTGVGEDGRAFEERTTTDELALQGAQFRLERAPRLQSKVQVVIDSPAGERPAGPQIHLRGIVVGCEPRGEKGGSVVTVIFIKEAERD
jgi:phosphoribosyl 1,2-cyclic phosphodiesterase